jgi:hypothetical protein
MNVTIPVGTAAPGLTGATVALNITGWPYTVLVAEAVSVVTVASRETVKVIGAEVLVEPWASPE